MSDEEYKISTLIRDAVFDSGDKSSVIGHYSHKAREIVEEARADEIKKFKEWFDEYTCLDDLFTFDDVMTIIAKYEQLKGGAE